MTVCSATLARFKFAFLTRVANYLFLFAGLIPIALVAWYVATQGAQGPIGDQWWDPVYIAVKAQTSTLVPEDFFVWTFGHRPVISRLLAALSATLTHFDTGILRFVAFAITLINLGLAMLLLSARLGLIPISFFIFGTLLFSLYSWDSWLDMYFASWHQALLFTLLGLVVLQRMHPGWLAISLLILCATAASFSLASGLSAWVSLPIAAAGISDYRRPSYGILWLLMMFFFLLFYTSEYGVHQFKTEDDLPALSRALRHGIVSASVYPFRFQAAHFDTNNLTAISLGLIGSLLLAVNLWQLIRSKGGIAPAALWGSLALYSVGVAFIVLFGRGPYTGGYYSPATEGFWIALIALALLVLARRPPLHLAVPNVTALLAVVIFSVHTDIRTLQSLADPDNNLCDQSIVNYPLYRDELFQGCFQFSEVQSVYHLAALRLSIFRNEMPLLILPRTDAPIITDMPNRWLSVYVRDYMLAGLPQENLYSIAPVPGVWPQQYSNIYISPYNRGELPTDILPRPLQKTWTSAEELASNLAILTHNQPVLWYLNTPETDGNFSVIERALSELGYRASKCAIKEARYAYAHFDLWRFERSGSYPQP